MTFGLRMHGGPWSHPSFILYLMAALQQDFWPPGLVRERGRGWVGKGASSEAGRGELALEEAASNPLPLFTISPPIQEGPSLPLKSVALDILATLY